MVLTLRDLFSTLQDYGSFSDVNAVANVVNDRPKPYRRGIFGFGSRKGVEEQALRLQGNLVARFDRTHDDLIDEITINNYVSIPDFDIVVLSELENLGKRLAESKDVHFSRMGLDDIRLERQFGFRAQGSHLFFKNLYIPSATEVRKIVTGVLDCEREFDEQVREAERCLYDYRDKQISRIMSVFASQGQVTPVVPNSQGGLDL